MWKAPSLIMISLLLIHIIIVWSDVRTFFLTKMITNQKYIYIFLFAIHKSSSNLMFSAVNMFNTAFLKLVSFLKLAWTNFHLRLFHGIIWIFPVVPAYSGGINPTCTQVQAIEVAILTVPVPPSSFLHRSTVISNITIIVTILGCELHLIVMSKRITCVTFQECDKILQSEQHFKTKSNISQ